MRHADALSLAEAKVTSDADRPLSGQGRQFLHRILPQLKKGITSLDLCWVSPYLRARQTAEMVLSEIPCRHPLETFDGLSPESPLKLIFEELSKRQTSEILMLVGHEPYMGLLLGYLLSGRAGFSMPFAKAGVACVEGLFLPPQGHPPRLRWFWNPPL